MSEFVDYEIEDMVADGEIVIDPFMPENLNGASYDLTLGPWFWRRKLFSQGEPPDVYAADQSHRFTLVDARGHGGVIDLEPMESVLAHSNEVCGGWKSVNTQIHATSTAGRNDVTVCRCAGFGDPGFVSIWVFELSNVGKSPIALKINTVVAQAVFRPVAVPKRIYGQQVGQYARGGKRSAQEIRSQWRPEHMLPKAMKVRTFKEDPWASR